MSLQDRIREWINELKELLNNISDDVSISEEKRIQLIIHSASLVCALVAVQPLPFADIFILTPIQVVMVIYLSRTLGNPVGDSGAKEIVSYIAGVVGWGVLAQQIILGGYKTIIPYFGGFTTIPLVYAATFGLGYAAKTILEARLNDREISKGEIKRISTEAKKKAKEESNIEWSVDGIKKEWANLKQQTQEYKQYIETISRLENELQFYKHKYPKDSLRKDIDDHGLKKVLQLQFETLSRRFSKYNRVRINPQVIIYLALLPKSHIDQVERQISFLQFNPSKANFSHAGQNPLLQEIKLDEIGRLFLSVKTEQIRIHSFEPILIENDQRSIGSFLELLYRGTKSKHLRNSEIREIFIEAINKAKSEIDIVSPWMSLYVVNDVITRFEEALQRGVTIKILYGINDSSPINTSKRTDQSDEVAQGLRDRFKVYGDKFRILRTNTHYKLLICDEVFYVQGSYNFLSFGGKYDENTRGEGAQFSENIEELCYLRDIYFSF